MLAYAQIEDGIIKLMEEASVNGVLGYRLASVGSYGGEFDDELFFSQAGLRKFPAVWVTVGGSKPKRISARKWELSPVIAVMVGARNVRGERATRRGTVTEVGTYQMLDDVRSLLVGRTLDLSITPLAVGADRTLFNTRIGKEGLSILSCEFTTAFTYTASDQDAEAPDLTRIDLNYYLKPGDDVVDATDRVDLAA